MSYKNFLTPAYAFSLPARKRKASPFGLARNPKAKGI